ncbi:MAG: D-alanyl-D-alanine carboxypeptidase, partial [Solirubrobacteraceae bacterium]|nr:D-alanyl-D-alanine carboxypeptidase [Solirubrobacteraceae bacterium]
MQRLRLVFFAIALLVAFAAPPAAGAASPKPADRALDRALQQLVAMPGGPPGVVAVVQRHGRVMAHTAGVADIATGRRIAATDHMRLASVAKAYSGAVALGLVDRGVLALDDTIGKWLPDLSQAWSGVTLRELLNHTSGLPDFSKNPSFISTVIAAPHRPRSMVALLRFIAGAPLAFPPGSRYQYSNSDNIAIALMVQAAIGRPYALELIARVFSPLGLTRTSLPLGFGMPRPLMHGYNVQPGQPAEDVTTLFSASLSSASGGVQSTPLELNAFIRGYVGGRLFGPAVRRQQRRLVDGGSEPPGPGQNKAGLAIFRYTTRCGTVYGHTGNTPGYTQFAAASLSGRRSATVSTTAQLTPAGAPLVFPVLRATFERA